MHFVSQNLLIMAFGGGVIFYSKHMIDAMLEMCKSLYGERLYKIVTIGGEELNRKVGYYFLQVTGTLTIVLGLLSLLGVTHR